MSYEWPPDSIAPAGIPPGLLVPGRLYQFETFCGDEAGNRSEKLFVTINSGGYVITAPTPAGGDVITNGVSRATLTPNPIGGQAGHRRLEVGNKGADSFGLNNGAPFICAMRFKMVSAIPTAVDDYFVSAGGISNQVAASAEPTNGVYIPFDRVAASWVLRAARAGVRIQRSLALAFDAAYHIVGWTHDGVSVTGFKDGVYVAPLAGAEVQPAAEVHADIMHLIQVALGLSFNAEIDFDWILWGPVF